MRHGHTPWNRAGKIQGRSDIALDDAARAGLRRQTLPPSWDKADLWSSPLCRAVETARLVTGHAPLVSDALIEMNWGDWEGLRGTDLRADPVSGFRDIENWGWDWCPPGGESPSQVRARLMEWAATVRRDAVVVSHIGVMRVLLAHATGWNFAGPAPFAIKRDRLYVIEVDGDKWSMQPDPIRLKEQC